MKLIINKKKRSRYDWESIWPDYKAGILSVREVGRKHSVDPSYLNREAKKYGIKRDLTARIKQAAKTKLVYKSVLSDNVDEIVEQKSDELFTIQVLHRKDIRALRDEEQRLLAELGESPKKIWIGQYKGEVVTHEVEIAVTERSSALQSLAGAMHKRILLERQAYGLDDDSPDDLDELKGRLTPEEKKIFRKAARIVSQRVIEQSQREHGE